MIFNYPAGFWYPAGNKGSPSKPPHKGRLSKKCCMKREMRTRNILLLIGLLLFASSAVAQTRFYDVTRTFHEQGFTYVANVIGDGTAGGIVREMIDILPVTYPRIGLNPALNLRPAVKIINKISSIVNAEMLPVPASPNFKTSNDGRKVCRDFQNTMTLSRIQ